MGIIRKLNRLALSLLAAAFICACNSESTPLQTGSKPPSENPTYTGQALLGPLVNAKVEVYSLATIDGAPIFTTDTADSDNLDEAGRFSIPSSKLDDNDLYIVKVSGGQDIDADDDGTRDDNPTENKGAIHALLTTDQIRRGDYHISILTEVLYRRLAYLLSAGYSKDDILNELNYRAGIALKTDINNDGVINDDDAVTWRPRLHQAALRHGFTPYQQLQTKIQTGAVLGMEAFFPTDFEVGGLMLPESSIAQSMALGEGVAGYIAVLPSAGHYLAIINVTDPLQPQLAGTVSLPSTTWLVAAQGKYFFVLGSTALYIIDASNPQTPVETSQLALPASFSSNSIYIDGNHIYLVSIQCDVMVIDISQPNAPVARGQTACGGISNLSMFHYSTYHNGAVYITTDHGTLQIIDVTNADSPAIAGNVAIEATGPMVAKGNYLYALDTASRIHIIDVTDIYHPFIANNASEKAYGLIGIDGDTLFAYGGDAILSYDISNPINPIPSSGQSPRRSNLLPVFKDGLMYEITVSNELAISSFVGSSAAPQTPTLARIEGPKTSAGITTNGNTAYISAYMDGLSVVDISNPLAPSHISIVNSPSGKAVPTDDKLYISGGQYLSQFDISNPANPIIKGTTDYTELFSHATTDKNLFASTYGGDLQIFDITQSQAIKPAGTLNLGNHYFANISLNEAGNLACMAFANGDLQVIDISTTVPTVLKSISLEPDLLTCRFHNGYIYATTSKGVTIIDANTVANASIVSSLGISTESPVLFDGDIAYIGFNGGIIFLYDISDPTSPAYLTEVSGHLDGKSVLTNHRIYTSSTIYDLSDALKPVEMESFTTPITNPNEFITATTASGTVAYVGTTDILTSKNTLYLIDVTNPASPSILSQIEIIHPDEGTYSGNLAHMIQTISINNGMAYVSGLSIGIQAIDVSDPLSPQVIGVRYNPIYGLDDITAKGSYAFIADAAHGLHVADFTDPTFPKFYKVSGATLPSHSLAMDGNILCSANDTVFQTIDISDPTNASVIGSVAVDSRMGTFSKMVAIDHMVYLANVYKLSVIDISNPTNPSIVGSASVLNYPWSNISSDPMMTEGKLYLTHGAAGIEVIDISDPTHPHTTAVIPVTAMEAAIKGDYLYLTSENSFSVIKAMTRTLP